MEFFPNVYHSQGTPFHTTLFHSHLFPLSNPVFPIAALVYGSISPRRGGLGLVGRYVEVKSVYLGKFKGRVLNNVIVYQQTGSRAMDQKSPIESIASTTRRIRIRMHTPEHRRYTPPRATNTSPSTLHTHLRLYA